MKLLLLCAAALLAGCAIRPPDGAAQARAAMPAIRAAIAQAKAALAVPAPHP